MRRKVALSIALAGTLVGARAEAPALLPYYVDRAFVESLGLPTTTDHNVLTLCATAAGPILARAEWTDSRARAQLFEPFLHAGTCAQTSIPDDEKPVPGAMRLYWQRVTLSERETF